MVENLAYLNGQWLPAAGASLSLHDAGFVMGATVTDLSRTFQHRLYRWEDHLGRFRRSCLATGIQPELLDDEITALAQELVDHNAKLLTPEEDLALVVFVTPGQIGYYAGLEGGAGDSPVTFGMHTFKLLLARYRTFHERGVSVVVPRTRHLPSDCVDRWVKHRSRMHWWLAHEEIRAVDPTAQALLLDHDGMVTETAAANFLVVQKGVVVSPSLDRVLEGISLQVVQELCRELGIGFEERNLTVPDCLAADEAFLTSTPYCLAGVSRFNGRPIPWPGPIFTSLLEAWSRKVHMDIRGQICNKAPERPVS